MNTTVISRSDAAATAAKISIELSYGPASAKFDIESGSTFNSLLNDAYIKEIIGFKGVDDESVMVNGQSVTRARILKQNDTVEVIKRAGEKA